MPDLGYTLEDIQPNTNKDEIAKRIRKSMIFAKALCWLVYRFVAQKETTVTSGDLQKFIKKDLGYCSRILKDMSNLNLLRIQNASAKLNLFGPVYNNEHLVLMDFLDSAKGKVGLKK